MYNLLLGGSWQVSLPLRQTKSLWLSRFHKPAFQVQPFSQSTYKYVYVGYLCVQDFGPYSVQSAIWESCGPFSSLQYVHTQRDVAGGHKARLAKLVSCTVRPPEHHCTPPHHDWDPFPVARLIIVADFAGAAPSCTH